MLFFKSFFTFQGSLSHVLAFLIVLSIPVSLLYTKEKFCVLNSREDGLEGGKERKGLEGGGFGDWAGRCFIRERGWERGSEGVVLGEGIGKVVGEGGWGMEKGGCAIARRRGRSR